MCPDGCRWREPATRGGGLHPNREIWVRELANGDWALALLNTGDKPAELSVDFHPMWFLGGKCQIRDLWD